MIESANAGAAEVYREMPLRVRADAEIRRTRKRNVRVGAGIRLIVRIRCHKSRARRLGMIRLGYRELVCNVREDADAKIARHSRIAVGFVGFCVAFSVRLAAVIVGNTAHACTGKRIAFSRARSKIRQTEKSVQQAIFYETLYFSMFFMNDKK